jgi:cell division protein ZapA (FtsZ GTPase activity inhibitor)
MSQEGLRVLRLFGSEVAIKTPPGAEHLLLEAMRLLKDEVAANTRRYPGARSQELLLLSALNLCARQLAQREPQTEQRLQALNQQILTHLQASA